jgi:hypothetical protein
MDRKNSAVMMDAADHAVSVLLVRSVITVSVPQRKRHAVTFWIVPLTAAWIINAPCPVSREQASSHSNYS